MVDALIPKDSKAVLSAASVFKTQGMMQRSIVEHRAISPSPNGSEKCQEHWRVCSRPGKALSLSLITSPNAAVTGFGRKKIIIAGLWTQLCVCFPAVEAIAEGYDVHVPTDACGDLTLEAHERAVQRAIQASVVPMTTLQVMFEWQRDWARTETFDGCMEILKAHSAYGIGLHYADAILGKHAGESGMAAG
jgi:hypothetical protein